jgi:hypothetical protein
VSSETRKDVQQVRTQNKAGCVIVPRNAYDDSDTDIIVATTSPSPPLPCIPVGDSSSKKSFTHLERWHLATGAAASARVPEAPPHARLHAPNVDCPVYLRMPLLSLLVPLDLLRRRFDTVPEPSL